MPKIPPPPAKAELRAIATLIAGDAPPDWLIMHLESWIGSLIVDRGVNAGQPTRSEMRARLEQIREAALLLLDEVQASEIREFLDASPHGPMENVAQLADQLVALITRSEEVGEAATIANAVGQAKRGPGKARPPGATPPEAFCALIISETWRHVRGDRPGARNERAQEAAERYWRLAGGEASTEANEPYARWRSHFERARKDGPESIRKEIRRHLAEHARMAAPSIGST